MSEAYTILVGDCRAMLATLPAESVQVVVTSPPYWALRAYCALEPQVWGGSAECEHVWGDALPKPGQQAGNKTPSAYMERFNWETPAGSSQTRWDNSTGGQHCQLCSAWLGHWGLEPSVELYVANTVEVLRAVRRVLRPDGTVWLNLGSTYASSRLAPSGAACGSDGIGRPDSQAAGPACSHSDGEHPVGSPPRRPRTTRTGQGHGEGGRPPSGSSHDSESSDASQASPAVVAPVSLGSTPPASLPLSQQSASAQDNVGCPSSSCPAPSDVQVYDGMDAYRRDRALTRRPLAGRTQGTAPLGLASSAPLAKAGGGGTYIDYTTLFPTFKPKDLIPMPWLVGLALQADGWWLRSVIVWHKVSCMPSSQTDRPTTDYEPILLLAKNANYFFDLEAGREGAVSTPHRLGNTKLARDGGTQSLRNDTDRQQEVIGLDGRRSPRTVWKLKPEPSNYEFCLACETMYMGGDRKGIKEFCGACGERWPRQKRSRKSCPACGDEDEARQRECPTCKSRTDWVAHYAAFPSSLPRKCIAMGTSEKGECPKCGTPWARVVEKSGGTTGHSWHDHSRDSEVGMTQARHSGGVGNVQDATGKRYSTTTLGWQPQCGCAAGDPVPQTCLDICLGTGTTAIVAVQMGRRAVGIELSPSYAKLAAERIRVLGTHKAKAAPRAAMPLFQEVSDE